MSRPKSNLVLVALPGETSGQFVARILRERGLHLVCGSTAMAVLDEPETSDDEPPPEAA